jgi:nitrite reductase (NADH) large subunit
MSTHFVIIGNGAAGYRAAKSLRQADRDAQVSLFTDERHPFYLRRQLGEFVAGNLTLPELIFQSRNAYRRERIDLFLMTPVERVDPDAHEVVFAGGQRVRYDRLLVATGTQAVPLGIPGTELQGVATFDTLSQAQEVKRLVGDVRRAAILGEGIVGLTLTESLVARGVRVTQFIRGERFWPEMLDERTSAMVEEILEDRGVALRRKTAAQAILGAGGRVIAVGTDGGETLPAELAAVGCRRRPAIDCVKGSGIDVGRGIRVDVALRTSRPDIFAAGDVVEPVGSDEFGEEGTAFCWQRAWAQGGLAAASMLDRRGEPVLEAVRVRALIFGHDLAVIGHGQLAEKDNVRAVELREANGVYRRLVFEDDLLIGAIVFGTGETVHDLNRLVAERAPRGLVETTLGLAPESAPRADLLPGTFARHCPICAAELVVHRGVRAGAVIQCPACSTDLVVHWDGQHGWLEINPP